MVNFLRCGWLEPSGAFFECGYDEHRYWANKKYNKNEDEMEENGYIKITFSIFDHRRKVICYRRPTEQQEKFIEENGYTDEEVEYWCH